MREYEVPIHDAALEGRIADAKREHARVVREKARAHPVLHERRNVLQISPSAA